MILRKEFISMKYNHTKKFYNEKYKTYKKEVKKIGGYALKKNEFISGYNALAGESKNIMKDLIYGSKYGTKYKFAIAEYRALKSAGIEGVKLEDLKLITTQDFADSYATQLSDAYRNLRSQGITGRDAAILISQQWFGSK